MRVAKCNKYPNAMLVAVKHALKEAVATSSARHRRRYSSVALAVK